MLIDARDDSNPDDLGPRDSKRCSRCREPKPRSDFGKYAKALDGLDCYCKPCRKVIAQKSLDKNRDERLAKRRANSRAYREKNRERIEAKAALFLSNPDATKTCAKCKETKPVAAFHGDRTRPDGVFAYCKRCNWKDPELRDEINTRKSAGLVRCWSCDQWLAPGMFYTNQSRTNRLHSQCKECCKAARKSWYSLNTEKAIRHQRQYYKKFLPAILARRRKYYYEHLEESRIYAKSYSQSPRGRASAARASHRRKSRVKSVANDLTAEQWQGIIASQGNKCAYCKTSFGLFLVPTRDHVIPVVKGGGLTRSNVVAACRSCNSSKRDRDKPHLLPRRRFA